MCFLEHGPDHCKVTAQWHTVGQPSPMLSSYKSETMDWTGTPPSSLLLALTITILLFVSELGSPRCLMEVKPQGMCSFVTSLLQMSCFPVTTSSRGRSAGPPAMWALGTVEVCQGQGQELCCWQVWNSNEGPSGSKPWCSVLLFPLQILHRTVPGCSPAFVRRHGSSHGINVL